jgi:hypothetical protein
MALSMELVIVWNDMVIFVGMNQAFLFLAMFFPLTNSPF